MPVELTVTATYPGDPDTIFSEALNPQEMVRAMEGLAVYDSLPDRAIVEGETLVVDVTIWGIVKNKGYRMFVETVDVPGRLLQSRESGAGVARWDHTLTVQPGGPGAIWTDRVVIDAGLRSGFMARFGAYMYARRHKYRKALSITVERRKIA